MGLCQLTWSYFLEHFPKAQEQLWRIEAPVDRDPNSCNNRFTYITAAGQKRSAEGDYLGCSNDLNSTRLNIVP